MFRSFLLIALRNINRNRLFSFINILGLSIGLACVFVILLYVRNEFSYDRYHEHARNTFRVALNRIYPDTRVNYPIIPHSVGPTMLQDFPEVEACTRIMKFPGEIPFQFGETTFNESNVVAADSNVFNMFSIRLLKGDPYNVLKDPNEVILSESTARKYFGEEEAVGKNLMIIGFQEVIVAGVFEDLPEHTHLEFDIIASLKLIGFINQPNYVAFSTHTYIRLRDPLSSGEIEGRMPELIRRYGAGQIQATMGVPYDDYIAAGNGYDYFLQPLKDIHLHSNMEGEFKPNGNYNYVIISISIAIFILILACINFMNLSTARSTERAKEVGIRKVVGSDRVRLIRQFLSESTLITLISLIIAVILAELMLPSFNFLANRNLSIQYFDSFTLPVLLGFTLLIGLLSGSFPAFVLSSFQPTQVLKGKFTASSRGRLMRNILVIVQFTVSVFLISFTILVYKQLKYLLNTDMGFDRENVLVVDGAIPAEQRETFKQELEKFAWVSSTGASGSEITGGYYPGYMIQVEEYGSEVITSRFISVDEDFLGTMNIEVLSGRGFSRNYKDSLNVLINETAVRDFNLAEPIGARFIDPVALEDGTTELREWTVIGVVEDFHYTSLHDNLNSFVLQSTEGPNGNFTRLLYIRLNTDDYEMAIVEIENKWVEFFPERPFKYYFLDDNIGQMYSNDRTSGTLFSIFTLLAIIIACVGLFGLAAYMAEQKTKQIGIRKVHGASVNRIVLLISSGFNKLILLAIVLSVPPAIWSMNRWLNNFAYRCGIPFWIFILAGLVALGIAFLTVSFHAVRTANKNPADTLRYE
jgi:putative ABC transport system permease protein